MDPDNNKVREINTRIMLCVNQAVEWMHDDGLTDNEILLCLLKVLGKERPPLDVAAFVKLEQVLVDTYLTYYESNPASMMPAAIISDEEKRRAKEQFVVCIQGHIDRIVKADSNLGDDGASESSAFIDEDEACVAEKIETNTSNNKGIKNTFSRVQSIVSPQSSLIVSSQGLSDHASSVSTDARLKNTGLIQDCSKSSLADIDDSGSARASAMRADAIRHEKGQILEVKVDANNKGKQWVEEAPRIKNISNSAPSIATLQPSHTVSSQVRSNNSSSDLADIKMPTNTSHSQKVSESRVSRFFGRVISSVVGKPPIMINCTAVHEMENDPSVLLQMIALNQPVEKMFPTNDDIFVQGDISVENKRYRLCIKDYIYPVYSSNDKIEAHLIDAQITLMIFDLTSVKSFKNITKHASEVIDRYNLHAPKILLGNKKSLDDRSAVNRAEIEQVAKDIHAVYFECSSASDMQTIREQIVRSYLTISERYLHRSHHVEVPAQSEGSKQMRNATKISCSTVHEHAAGSSSLFRQIVKGWFTHGSEWTIYSDLFRRDFILDNELFDVLFVDAGAIRIYPNIDAIYKQLDVSVILLLFDLSRRETFEEIDRLAEKVKGINAATRLILIGTKSDLVDARAVTREEAEAAATRLNIPYFECSAKDNVNLENICAQIIREYKSFVSENDGCMPQLENRPT